jgi:uncharacterized Rossmann fold enzyme
MEWADLKTQTIGNFRCCWCDELETVTLLHNMQSFTPEDEGDFRAFLDKCIFGERIFIVGRSPQLEKELRAKGCQVLIATTYGEARAAIRLAQRIYVAALDEFILGMAFMADKEVYFRCPIEGRLAELYRRWDMTDIVNSTGDMCAA